MILHQLQSQPRVRRLKRAPREVVSSFLEYSYYGLIIYGVMPFTQGLSIRLASGGVYAALAAYLVMRIGPRAITPIIIPLVCGISFVALQMLVHNASLMAIKPFIIWMFQLVIVQCLYLRREFLHRFAAAALLIGLLLLPFLDYGTLDGNVVRVGTERGAGLGNPNELAQWFGFLCVYFMIAGIEGKRTAVRIACWLVGAGCFYIVGLTVSRGALLAIVISIVVALRRLLKHGFLPTLSLLLLAWILYTTGIFDQATTSYGARGTVETGRLVVWPLVIERFLNSSLLGVGLSDIGTYGPYRGPMTPHNSFLFIALASGIIPLMFFVAYWWRAARGAFYLSDKPSAYAPFSVPLLIYTFLSVQSISGSFMEVWAIVSLAMTMTPSAASQVRGIERGRTADHLERLHERRYRLARPQRFVRPTRL